MTILGFAGVLAGQNLCSDEGTNTLQLKYYAQSAFHITADDGTRIMIDPYAHTERIRYDATFDEADIVLVTHEHGDHNNVDAVPGDHRVVRGVGTQAVQGMTFHGIGSYHDNEKGAQRGPNTVFIFDVDGIRIVVLGDQGCELEPMQAAQLRGANVLLAPVGSGPTLEHELIWKLAEELGANILVPCHFKTPDIDVPLLELDDFLQNKDDVRRVGGSEVTLDAGDLPEPVQVLVLDRSR